MRNRLRVLIEDCKIILQSISFNKTSTYRFQYFLLIIFVRLCKVFIILTNSRNINQCWCFSQKKLLEENSKSNFMTTENCLLKLDSTSFLRKWKSVNTYFPESIRKMWLIFYLQILNILTSNSYWCNIFDSLDLLLY